MNDSTAGPVTISNATKRFRRGSETVVAVRGVTFQLLPGSLTVLAGPSGSGKTTLLNLIVGWDDLDDGQIDGVAEQADWSRLAIVPQRLGLLPHLTISENIAFPCRTRPSAVDLVELSSDLGVAHLTDRFPDETSLGEQQRTAVARALVLQPSLLVADEPTSHQDEHHVDRIIRRLRHCADHGSVVLVATHDRRVAEHADQHLEIVDGIVGPLAGLERIAT